MLALACGTRQRRLDAAFGPRCLPHGSGANKVQANADLRQGSFYAAASTAFQTAGVLPPLRRSLPRLNCRLWIRRSSSTPAIVIVAVMNCEAEHRTNAKL